MTRLRNYININVLPSQNNIITDAGLCYYDYYYYYNCVEHDGDDGIFHVLNDSTGRFRNTSRDV